MLTPDKATVYSVLSEKKTPLRIVLALVIAFMMLADLLALASPQTLPAKYKNSPSITFEAIRQVEVLSSNILLISKLRPFFFSRKTTLYNKKTGILVVGERPSFFAIP